MCVRTAHIKPTHTYTQMQTHSDSLKINYTKSKERVGTERKKAQPRGHPYQKEKQVSLPPNLLAQSSSCCDGDIVVSRADFQAIAPVLNLFHVPRSYLNGCMEWTCKPALWLVMNPSPLLGRLVKFWSSLFYVVINVISSFSVWSKQWFDNGIDCMPSYVVSALLVVQQWPFFILSGVETSMSKFVHAMIR